MDYEFVPGRDDFPPDEIARPDRHSQPQWRKKMTNREFSADLFMAPKKVKRKRYINVYPDEWQRGDVIYTTKELADTYAYTHRIACVEVEYEFEV